MKRRSEYVDEEITFVMNVYQDYLNANWSLSHLRRHFPRSRLLVISDGDNDPRLEYLPSRYGAEFKKTAHLGGPWGNGGGCAQKRLQFFLEGRHTPYLIQIHPDSGIYRRFNYLPDENFCAFGSVIGTRDGKGRPYSYVHGGCLGLTFGAAKRLYDSKALLWDEWKDPAATYLYSSPELTAKNLVFDDYLMGYVCTQLSIPLLTWGDEINCYNTTFSPSPADQDGKYQYAITHPCKDGKLWLTDTHAVG